MKKQFLLLALTTTTATIHSNNFSSEKMYPIKKNHTEENIYKATFLLGVMSMASAISSGDNKITRSLGYAAASGFFLAPLANAYKEKKLSNHAMLALSGLITGGAFIKTSDDFEHQDSREILGSITAALAGLSNIKSGRKFIHNAFFSALSCIGGYKAYTNIYKTLYPEPHTFTPLEEFENLENESLSSFENQN